MFKAFAFILLVTFAASYHIRENHEYWYTAGKSVAESKVPFADVAWNYCDYKCLTFETFPGQEAVDFFVINFGDSVPKPDFAACYGQKVGDAAPKLWNTFVQNEWYNKNCGDDKEDYLTNNKYTKKEEVGKARNTLLNY